MIPWIKSFFMDKAFFTSVTRALLVGIGTAAISGKLPALSPEYEWAGTILIGIGMMLRSSHPLGKHVDEKAK